MTAARPAAALLACALALGARAAPPALFTTSDRCSACHNGLTTKAGGDVSIGIAWRASIMANSARDPYWQAAVSREIADHLPVRAAIEDVCATCHMPMSRYEAHAAGRAGQVFAHLPFGPGGGAKDRLAEDGVSCALCHGIEQAKLGTRESYDGGFAVDGSRPPGDRRSYGPFAVEAGLDRVMQSATGFRPVQSEHVRRSELCATCHTLFTTAYRDGQPIGQLPEQMPYVEWLHGAFKDVQSCQDCHMPKPGTPAPIASVLGPVREDFREHTFPGGNFLVLGMLDRYRVELDVTALPSELGLARAGTLAFLRDRAARLAVQARPGKKGTLEAEVKVENLTGHKLPTAFPSRRAWIRLAVKDARGRTVFESGRLNADGSIEGNDNDADPRAYEPHYARITRQDEVQIYESILAAPDGTITTGLLSATHYAKDNRLLPEGFDKAKAPPEIAVVGAAAKDPEFRGGGHRVLYVVPLGAAVAPLRVEAELWYQPIAFRWAMNHTFYPQAESRRFVRWYREMSASSATTLAAASAVVPSVRAPRPRTRAR
jgi:hypothetical protein